MELLNTILDLLGKAPIQVVLLILGVAFLLLGLGLKTPWGQITDKKLRWVGVVFGGIFAIASLLCIFAFDCGAGSVIEPTPEATETVAPGEETPTTETPAPTVDVTTLSAGAQFLAADYFGGLNDGVTMEDDLADFWDLLAKSAQKSQYNNDYDEYETHWWARRVKFTLYECSDTAFVVDLDYYAREDTDFGTSIATIEDLKYTLTEKSGMLSIDSIEDISAEGHFCDLVYEN
jgi:hypothetical protein